MSQLCRRPYADVDLVDLRRSLEDRELDVDALGLQIALCQRDDPHRAATLRIVLVDVREELAELEHELWHRGDRVGSLDNLLA